MHVQGPSERVLLSGTRLSASLGGRGYSASERNNRAMTGQIDQLLPGGPTVWRRRRCWDTYEITSKLSHATQTGAAMIRKEPYGQVSNLPVLPTKPPKPATKPQAT